MQCANMDEEMLMLQGVNINNGLGYSWHFVVDTCYNLRQFTGKTEADCQPQDTTMAMINDFVIEVKKSNQFFSP